MSSPSSDGIRNAAGRIGADLPGRRHLPGLLRFVVAAVVAVGLALLACWAVAAVSIAVDPALRSYGHLQAPDWAKLTILGVGGATLGWPLACALWSRARLPFLVLTAIVTVVSLAPDAWILRQGQTPAGVAALVVMHVAVAVVAYPALVLLAPQRRVPRHGRSRGGPRERDAPRTARDGILLPHER